LPAGNVGIRQLLQQLEAHDALPDGVQSLLPALHTMNLAAHGANIDSSTVDKALSRGNRFLTKLERDNGENQSK
jgi:hypothetical protein